MKQREGIDNMICNMKCPPHGKLSSQWTRDKKSENPFPSLPTSLEDEDEGYHNNNHLAA